MSYESDDTDEQLSDEQKALARKWSKRLERALKKQSQDKTIEKYRKLRKYVRGDVGDDGKGGLVRTNIIHANFAAILPQVYAKNPEIAVTPSESATGASYAWVGNFCKTLQAVLGRVLVNDGKLKPRAKGAIRAAMTTGIGWVKLSWQKDIRRDPIIDNRIADTQDNLQRIQMLIDEINEGDDSRDELDAKKAELEQQMAALEQQAEVTAAEGIVLDRVLTEDVFILDDTLYDFDAYAQGEAIAHRVWMTCEDYKQTFGKEAPEKANRYGSDKKESSRASEDDNAPKLVAVFEVWHRVSNTVYTLCAGAEEWAREPYVPEVLGKRFYPFFALAFNPVDGRVEPISDTELLIELQDEYNTTRTNFAEHRKENLPTRVFRKSGDLSDNDIRNLSNRKSNDWIGIEGSPGTPITDDIAILQNPPVDPMTYDVQPILRDAELVLGAGDAAKGTINKAKTATEAEIMAQGLQSRIAERQDVVEDWIGEMAQYSAELCLQELTLEQVQRISGADSVWPQLSKNDVFDMVNIEIRAGSAGRPNKGKEREQWGQMLPQIQQSVQQVMELRQNGQNDMAETVMKLLEETLRRFDERIDIESFLPAREEGQQAPQIPPEVQQKMQQGEQMMAQMQEENAKLKQIAEGKAAEMDMATQRLNFDKAKADADRQAQATSAEQASMLRLEETRIKAEADAAAKVEAERIRADLEREKLASQERIALQTAMISAMGQRATAQDAASAQAQSEESAASEQKELAAMMQNMNEAMNQMAQMFMQGLDGMRQQITAPKRVVRDAEGNMVGVETLQ